MKTSNLIDNIHANAPARLIGAVRNAGSERNYAKVCGIDHHYVSQLLHKGIEPTDQTERGQEIRVMLFLSRKKRKHRNPKPEEWPGQKKTIKTIRAMHRKTTRTFKSWRKT